MKLFILISIVTLFHFRVNGQKNIDGFYYNYFGNKLEINSDSTFKNIWRFDLSSSWTSGVWNIKNDTIYFKIIPVMDTLKFKSNNKIDRLVLSINETPESITEKDYALNATIVGGQNKQPIPLKLYYKNGKLIEVDETGNLIKKKVKGILTNKKYNPWYIKQ